MSAPTLSAADTVAGAAMLATEPHWAGLARAADVTGADRCLWHAGPPFPDWSVVPLPVRNSLALACIYEGWAATLDDAWRLLASGDVEYAPAQDHQLVVPLAGVISPSMALHVIGDPASGRVRYAALNEGMEHCLRLGIADSEIPEFHRWLNGRYAIWLAGRLERPMPLLGLLAESLERGDDGHSRTVAGSRLFADRLLDDGAPADVRQFLTGCGAFALNIWMGAAALILSAAEGVEHSGMVTRAGGNGVDFGVQLAGRPGQWQTVPAVAPVGPVEAAHAGRTAVGAIGDSAVVDVLGLGGQSLRRASTVVAALDGYLPADALDRPQQLLTLALDSAGGIRTGLSAHTVSADGIGPLVLLGMISDTGHGRIGGGVYEPPATVFTSG
ncbi:hypothetical protein A5731_01800 [Mycolicibacterium conceptionense]|uniref:DUF1116 domain-containing protein n=1 Tax=Mycolicibacterium conceptionense TaxID=451644 RepID=A0A1A0P873_9MYCO|nr:MULTISPECIES: DUF1116 domain-containing protein [Mycolicibacterium]MCW1822303.1 DUF1116 domain-containing protein [Mycolicibacterium senegalense]OBB05489.1 hypothetical protein A5718_22180 [Mycolicibacterium conceptionense]OBE96078.1 hypothetical protein A5731_01800 [Mycolicibacterium conceptionense]OBF19613.1 hypothetical protein A5726_17310 [Mycolicibacterium conceptionense]OBF48151.1 hypothetical protein A5720_03735 [Mycolicibacterium conceptionense]